ncbi:DUF1566 domain-containing protein [Paracrocinitomix mangrovi]|uniref:DUF1566 domain-containing protein n=1 Tax=Paracrocinitomix mangrovi TaxID=2862509 RepID=UPI001C8EB704|nr:DUF1566 domain-containing protein [Paracrocinitomix mangrovi]UKN01761.1 DUF1566 domain-containing protein [Paracrocinitomix mangrovi]
MKKFLLTSLFAVALSTFAVAQSPEKFNYQAIVRDNSGASVNNQLVGVRISILQGSSLGPEVFSETHGPTTNAYGLINLQIGTGFNTGPQIGDVAWESNLHFIKIEIDPTGGTNYTVSSVAQLISVPYALHAQTVDNADDADADPTNEFNTGITLNGDSLEITDGGGTVTADLYPLTLDPDMDASNELQTLSKVGQIVTLSNGGGAFTDDVDDADADPTNEYNTGVALVGTTLQVTDGGSTISTDLSSLANDADNDPTNEYNTNITLVGTTLNVFDAGGAVSVDLSSLANDADNDPTNEYNTSVVLSGTTLQVTDGGGTINTNLSSLVNDADANPLNELQSVSQVGSTVTLSLGGGSFSINDGDSDATNEFNIGASLSGSTLNIVDGGGTVSVDLSSLGGGGNPTDELNTTFVLTGNVLEITDAGGTLTADLTPIISGGGDLSTTNELNTSVVLSGTNLEVTDPGGTIITDLSPLVNDADADPTNELITGASLVGTDLNIVDAGGTTVVDLSPLSGGGDPSTTNELNTLLNLNGTTLELTDAGGMLTVDLSSLSGGGGGIKVGQYYQGGIVVYVDSTGIHGLIAGVSDLGTSAFEQSPNSTTEVATSLTDGAANTALLVAAGPGEYLAAEMCDAYTGGGFTDWYLPSAYELQIMSQNQYVMALFSAQLTLGNQYWSSSETVLSFGQNAWYGENNGVYIGTDSQLQVKSVRPMRAF